MESDVAHSNGSGREAEPPEFWDFGFPEAFLPRPRVAHDAEG